MDAYWNLYASDPRFTRRAKEALKPVAIRELDLADNPFSPYLLYERGCDLKPSEFGNSIRETPMAVMMQAKTL